MPDEYKAIQAKKVQIFKLRCDYLSTGLAYKQTAIRALEADLYKLEHPKGENETSKKDITLGQIVAQHQRELPFQIDKKKMSTQYYYDLTKV